MMILAQSGRDKNLGPSGSKFEKKGGERDDHYIVVNYVLVINYKGTYCVFFLFLRLPG